MLSGRLIREARKRAGLSQAEFGARTGRAASAISRWESGRNAPSLETLRELVRASGFDLDLRLVPTDDHDLALIRRSLRRTPEERLREMVGAVRALVGMSRD